MTLLIGADPELFLKVAGNFFSGYGVIPGTKQQPHPVEFGAVQVDGMAVEFNISPADTQEKFVGNIQEVMKQLREMIPTKFDLAIEPVAEFTKETMDATPEEAKELGCDPDFSAYTAEVNPRPAQHPIMRTAAGHVHLGWTANINTNEDHDHFMACCALTKQLDFFLGLPSVLLDPDTKRKQMYGKAGAFRPKPYGLEYRVLSNFWLTDKKLMELVYNNTQQAYDLLAKQGRFLPTYYGDVDQIINNNDYAAAKAMCQEIGIPFGV